MGKIIDIKGEKFGKLQAIDFIKLNNDCRAVWLCKCDCGKYCYATTSALRSGKKVSCGCYKLKTLQTIRSKHNLKHTRIYDIWIAMKQRCFNSNNSGYKYYGARGITVCSEWLGENGFINFYNWAVENGYRDNLTIDRINVNGNYEPSNCRWSNNEEQSYNKRNTLKYKIKEDEKCLAEWCKIYNVKYITAYSRLQKGYTIEEALTTVINKK